MNARAHGYPLRVLPCAISQRRRTCNDGQPIANSTNLLRRAQRPSVFLEQLIQHAYGGSGAGPEQQRTLQAQLFELQKRPEAWGLVVPLLANADANVAFFGAHTAQVKIARDWCAIYPWAYWNYYSSLEQGEHSR